MTIREQLNRCWRYQPARRVPNIECGVWNQTILRWLGEGMPAEAGLEKITYSGLEGITYWGNEFFAIDGFCPVSLSVEMFPGFEPLVLAEDERTITRRGPDGVVTRAMKDGSSMPAFIDFPVKCRADFKALRRRYVAGDPGRYPQDWAQVVRQASASTHPVLAPGIGTIGFYSMLRRWMGTENACTVFYDDTVWAHEMCEFIMEFALAWIERLLGDVRVDVFLWFEDYSFKNGPLVSPKIFKEFLAARYRTVNEALRRAGIEVIFLDTDGDPRLLLPLLLDAGINGTMPIECAAGMDPVALRKQFGRGLLLWGGIDKRTLARTKQDIAGELTYKIPRLIEDGGYLPMVDHLVPPDVPYENWLYYIELKQRLLDGSRVSPVRPSHAGCDRIASMPEIQ